LIYRNAGRRRFPHAYRNIPAGAEHSAMPYRVNGDLPPSVRHHLPEHAQDIYREAFNHAFAAHAGELDREKRAHMIAWAAVKHSYVKDGDTWVAR
jgi:cation transport regulator